MNWTTQCYYLEAAKILVLVTHSVHRTVGIVIFKKRFSLKTHLAKIYHVYFAITLKSFTYVVICVCVLLSER